jgi:hypothetical protein
VLVLEILRREDLYELPAFLGNESLELVPIDPYGQVASLVERCRGRDVSPRGPTATRS